MALRAWFLPARSWYRLACRIWLVLLLWQPGEAMAADAVISAAEFAEPTTAYPHGVLGDDQEWGQLLITVKRERGQEGGLFSGHVDLTYRIKAQPDSVFEDIAPRLWDVTGDGLPEVVVVESHQSLGARLLIVGLIDGTLEYVAATPHIGQRFRWLAPIGAADLDGDGNTEIAFVDRPHLAKVLRVWRYDNGEFSEIAAMPGISNHRIGEDFISGGIRDCGSGPEVVTADAQWQRIILSTLKNEQIDLQDFGPLNGPQSLPDAMACR